MTSVPGGHGKNGDSLQFTLSEVSSAASTMDTTLASAMRASIR